MRGEREDITDAGEHDALVRELRGLVGTGWPAPAGGPRLVFRRVRRRVVARAVATTALVAAIAVGVPLGLGLEDTGAAPVQPATQEPSPTAAEPSMPALPTRGTAATVEPWTPQPSASPSEVAAPTGETSTSPPLDAPAPAPPLEVVVDPSRPVRSGELAGFPETEPEPGVTLDHVAGSWTLEACGRGWASDARRTGWMSEGYTHESLVVREAAVYASEQEARAALAELTAAVQDCAAQGRRPDGSAWTHVEVTDDGLEALQRYLDEPTGTFDDVGDTYRTEVLLLRRDGRVVTLLQPSWFYGGGLEVDAALLERMMDAPRRESADLGGRIRDLVG